MFDEEKEMDHELDKKQENDLEEEEVQADVEQSEEVQLEEEEEAQAEAELPEEEEEDQAEAELPEEDEPAEGVEEDEPDCSEEPEEEAPVPCSEDEEEEVIPSMEETEAALDFEPLQPGDVVQGTVVQVNDENVLVDVRYKSDGVIPLSELKLTSGQKPQDVFTVGQEIPVYILSVDGRDGAVLASYRRALDEIAWDRLYVCHEENEALEAPVVEEVKGGLVLDVFGLRGFMPASHVDRGFVSDLSNYVGKKVRSRVIELDRNKNRIILSRKIVLDEEHQQKRDETWASLEEGQVRTGVVKGVTDFGAFVDLGGVDGLLHVSQMSWGRVDHPSDVVNVGEEIEVKVLRVDPEDDKISLGLKQLQSDPWENVDQNYSAGEVVEGRVMRIAPFGAFVELEPGVEGLVHISELADYHVGEPSEVVSEGEDVAVKVLRVQPEERRISLSLKEARRNQEQTRQQRRAGGLTLGDVFGDLLTETRERLSDEKKNKEEEK
ncbi:MAG: 30S ribosomal protein S1 [Bacillota bacterium]